MGSKSIYSPKSLNCYVSGGNNTGQKHSKIIVFPFGFSWSFLSVAFLSLRIHLEQHCRVRMVPKRSLFFRWESIPLWGLLRVFESFMAREGGFPIYPNCYNVWKESFKTIPTDFLLSHFLSLLIPQHYCKLNLLSSWATKKIILASGRAERPGFCHIEELTCLSIAKINKRIRR